MATRLTANDSTALLHAAIAGGGVSLLPTYLAQPWITRGKLRALLPAWSPPLMTIYALYPSRRHLPPAVRALLDFLIERFATPRW